MGNLSDYFGVVMTEAEVVALGTGIKNIWIPVQEMWDTSSNPIPPGALATYQGTAFQKAVRYRAFSGSTLNGTHVTLRLPKSWDPTQGISVRFHWVASTTATGEVQWKVNFGWTADDEDSRGSYNSQITCFDSANGTQYDKHISPIGTFNAAGSPAKSDDLHLLIWRDGAADANNAHQWLEGITLFYHVDALTDD